jgi:hypothetical protein
MTNLHSSGTEHEFITFAPALSVTQAGAENTSLISLLPGWGPAAPPGGHSEP